MLNFKTIETLKPNSTIKLKMSFLFWNSYALLKKIENLWYNYIREILNLFFRMKW